MDEKEDAALLRLSAQFLNRFNRDPNFRRKFDRDPAGALQELFPQLAKVPKKKIADVLDAHTRFMDAAFATPEATRYEAAGGLLSAATRVATRVARTSAVRSAATAVASSVASAVASKLLSAVAEPEPE